MINLLIGLIIGGICIYFILKPELNKIIQINTKNQEVNKKLEQTKSLLTEEVQALKWEKNLIKSNVEELSEQAKKSANEYYQMALDKEKIKLNQEKEKFNKAKEEYQVEYTNVLKECSLSIEKEIKELNKIKSTRESLIKANLREKEIKEQKDFYCLHIDPLDETDIEMLKKIKPKLNKPRILSMLIWSTYFQKQTTQLCNNVLKGKTVCGIYKITNLDTNECYIGQARDVAVRWKEHCKCGLGIDTPARNKLYKAMQEYGLTKFSFELLEECPIEQLNEKETYYINLYDSANFGYNTLKGNKK